MNARRVYESIEFKRGEDPYDALGVGIVGNWRIVIKLKDDLTLEMYELNKLPLKQAEELTLDMLRQWHDLKPDYIHEGVLQFDGTPLEKNSIRAWQTYKEWEMDSDKKIKLVNKYDYALQR